MKNKYILVVEMVTYNFLYSVTPKQIITMFWNFAVSIGNKNCNKYNFKGKQKCLNKTKFKD